MAEDAEKKNIAKLDFKIDDAMNKLDKIDEKLKSISDSSEAYAKKIGQNLGNAINSGMTINTNTINNGVNILNNVLINGIICNLVSNFQSSSSLQPDHHHLDEFRQSIKNGYNFYLIKSSF